MQSSIFQWETGWVVVSLGDTTVCASFLVESLLSVSSKVWIAGVLVFLNYTAVLTTYTT